MNEPIVSAEFRTIFRVLTDYFPNANAVETFHAAEDITSRKFLVKIPHENLVKIALGNGVIRQHLQYGKKINAIRELRYLTGCGIREAKEAIEDEQVYQHYNAPAPAHGF